MLPDDDDNDVDSAKDDESDEVVDNKIREDRFVGDDDEAEAMTKYFEEQNNEAEANEGEGEE